MNMDRFWAKVDQSGQCWIWTGATANGYGVTADSKTKQSFRAHRVAYEALVGPIPDGLVLDHLCRVRSCVNPAHLEPVTIGENVRRGLHGPRTHCPQGHLYAETGVPQARGRECILCRRERQRRYYARQKVAS